MIDAGLKRSDSRPQAENTSAAAPSPSTPTAPRSASFKRQRRAHLMNDPDQFRRILRPPLSNPHRRSAPRILANQLTPTAGWHDSFGREQQQPGKQQIPPEALRRSCASSVGGASGPAVSPPARPSAAAAISCGSSGGQVGLGQIDVARHDDRRLGVASLRADLVEALLGQLEHLGPSPSSDIARAGGRQRHARDRRTAVAGACTAGIDDVADRQPAAGLAIGAR